MVQPQIPSFGLVAFNQLFVTNRCSFTFDPDNFPDPKAYLAEIKRKYGVKICVWSTLSAAVFSIITLLKYSAYVSVNPYISQLSPVFQEAVAGGYLIKRTDGKPWQYAYFLRLLLLS